MPRIVVVSPNRDAWSETFIAAHIRHLPDVVLVLTDGHLPKRDADGRLLLDPSPASRLRRRISGGTTEQALGGAIEQKLRNERVEVVLAEYGPTGEALCGICQRLGIPLVVHFHGIDAFHKDLLEKHQHYAAIFRQAAALVVVSREMEAQLLALGAPRDRVHYLPYGIDVERFLPGDPAAAPATFVAVGRFVDKKAPHLTLLAFHRAWQQEPGIRLAMAGDGPLMDSSVQLVRALGLTDAVTFKGVLAPADVASLMRNARAFIQHSLITLRNDHEGTPLSVLEAMASGLPVIATRHGGIPDVVEHGEQGLLSAERDITAMADHLVRLARDPTLAADMGRKGRSRVMQRHRQPDRLHELHTLLQRVARG